METMSYSALLALTLFSGIVIYWLLFCVAYMLRRFGIDLRKTPAKVSKKAEKVIAKIEYYSEDGWHVVFNRGFGTCYGILTNLSSGQAEPGVECVAEIIEEPNGSCGFYQLVVL